MLADNNTAFVTEASIEKRPDSGDTPSNNVSCHGLFWIPFLHSMITINSSEWLMKPERGREIYASGEDILSAVAGSEMIAKRRHLSLSARSSRRRFPTSPFMHSHISHPNIRFWGTAIRDLVEFPQTTRAVCFSSLRASGFGSRLSHPPIDWAQPHYSSGL
jgi:hypothetical protein